MKTLDPQEVGAMTTLQLLQQKEMLERVIEEAQTDILGMKNEISERMKTAGLKTDKVGKWLITRYEQTSFKTTLEQARELGAVQTKEVVNTTVLKKLHGAGAKVPGVQIDERLRIGEIQEGVE